MITVHGYLGMPDVALCEVVMTADLVVAPERTLEALAIPEARRLRFGAISVVAQALAERDPRLDIRVLASGDPLFFGVVRRLRQAGIACQVAPTVSSLAALCAAVGIPWDDAVLASAHGRAVEPVLAACRARPKVAVLTAPGAGLTELAAGLADLPRWYVVGERLGETGQRVRVLDGPTARSVTDVADPHVVLVLAYPPTDPRCLGDSVAFAGGGPPYPGDAHCRDGEPSLLAAAVVGRLLPALGDLVVVHGPLSDDLAGLLMRTGAAVMTLGDWERVPGARPTYVVLGGPDALTPRGRTAVAAATVAAVLITGTQPPPVPGANPPRRIEISDTHGTATAYLTVIPAGPADPGARNQGAA